MKKPNREKKSIKLIRILKKLTSLVRFWFYKPKTEKTKPSQTGKKPSQTGFPPKITEPKSVGLNRFRFSFVFFTGFGYFFFIKTELNQTENDHPYFEVSLQLLRRHALSHQKALVALLLTPPMMVICRHGRKPHVPLE